MSSLKKKLLVWEIGGQKRFNDEGIGRYVANSELLVILFDGKKIFDNSKNPAKVNDIYDQEKFYCELALLAVKAYGAEMHNNFLGKIKYIVSVFNKGDLVAEIEPKRMNKYLEIPKGFEGKVLPMIINTSLKEGPYNHNHYRAVETVFKYLIEKGGIEGEVTRDFITIKEVIVGEGSIGKTGILYRMKGKSDEEVKSTILTVGTNYEVIEDLESYLDNLPVNQEVFDLLEVYLNNEEDSPKVKAAIKKYYNLDDEGIEKYYAED